MRLFAQLPFALQPDAKEALLICYGVGVTADAIVRDPRIAHLDVVDVSREVFALADALDPGAGAKPLRDPRVTTFVQDGRFFLQACPGRYDLITGEPPPLKVAGAVNLYTAEFFTLMNRRLNDGGIATFWLPIYQLQVDEVKAVLKGFHQAFPNASVWAGPDQEWIMVGMKGPGRALTEAELRRGWTQPATAEDLVRHGVEVPEQLGAMFVMDAAEIERITRDVAPLTDGFPKRLGDAAPDAEAIHRFAWTYMEGAPAYQHFRASALIQRIWPASLRTACEPFFVLREVRYLSSITTANWLAALDLYLRGSKLRTPVLEVFHTDEVRVAIAEQQSRPPVTNIPPGLTPDLVAGALARRDYPAAIRLLEGARSRGLGSPNDLFLLVYLHCLTGNVRKAEALAAAAPAKDDFAGWLWEKLQADFGFHPPR